MAESMSVRIEIWPIAADEIGVWLISGDDAWRPALPVMADSEPHAEVELTLAEHDALDEIELLHSTSWRVDGQAIVLTYVAMIRCSDLVRENWPTALPVSLELADTVGRPPTHSPTSPPMPRYVDVLMHALRHLRFLMDTDATSRAAMNEHWLKHLSAMTPALATMYSEEHAPA